jgi:hypothetical protein
VRAGILVVFVALAPVLFTRAASADQGTESSELFFASDAALDDAWLEALSVEARARTLATTRVELDVVALRARACAGDRVVIMQRPDPPTARPLLVRLGCIARQDVSDALPFPLDVVTARTFALAVVDLAELSEDEATDTLPRGDLGTVAATPEPVTSGAESENARGSEEAETEQESAESSASSDETLPREVIVTRRSDWSNRVFLRAGLGGRLDLRIPDRSERVSFGELASLGAELAFGAGFEAASWFRIATQARLSWSSIGRAAVQLGIAPEFVLGIGDEILGIAPEVLVGYSDRPGIGGALSIQFDLTMGPDATVRPFGAVRLSAFVFEQEAPRYSIGVVIGSDFVL